jgi:hypothetical protein
MMIPIQNRLGAFQCKQMETKAGAVREEKSAFDKALATEVL